MPRTWLMAPALMAAGNRAPAKSPPRYVLPHFQQASGCARPHRPKLCARAGAFDVALRKSEQNQGIITGFLFQAARPTVG